LKTSPLYVYWVSLVAATSGLLFGYDIAVINGALLFLRQQFGLSEVQTEFAASALLVGCVLGAAIGGWLSDRLGRRITLRLCALLFALSAVGAAIPGNLTEFAAARFAGGVAIGTASVLAPLYIAEVSPARIRGRLVALNQMAIVTGILLAYFANWVLSFQGESSWRWMFATAAVPSAFFFVALFFVPESPRWLVEKGRDEEARAVLARVSDPNEVEAIKAAIAEESGTLADLLQPGFRRAFWLAVALAVLQQWTGINSVLFYGSFILKDYVGGQGDSSAIGANVLIGAVNCLSTIVALAWIDKYGRKPLLIGSAAGLGLSLSALAFVFLLQPPPGVLVVGLMLAAAACFAVGLGPVVWVLLSEVFPTKIRGRAMGIATVSLWVACTVLTMTFLSISRRLGPSGAFGLYAGFNFLTVWIVFRFAPETKGRTLEEIEEFWRRRG
jgi:sugar porter (SP) family MFS transporter